MRNLRKRRGRGVGGQQQRHNRPGLSAEDHTAGEKAEQLQHFAILEQFFKFKASHIIRKWIALTRSAAELLSPFVSLS